METFDAKYSELIEDLYVFINVDYEIYEPSIKDVKSSSGRDSRTVVVVVGRTCDYKYPTQCYPWINI